MEFFAQWYEQDLLVYDFEGFNHGVSSLEDACDVGLRFAQRLDNILRKLKEDLSFLS